MPSTKMWESAFLNLAGAEKHFSWYILKSFPEMSFLAMEALIINKRYDKLASFLILFLRFYYNEKMF